MTPDFSSPDYSHFNERGEQWAWDATSISLYQSCPRKYYYKIICGWQPYKKSVHLLFGGIYATALEHYYLYVSEGQSKDEALRNVVREALTASWDFELNAPLEWDADLKAPQKTRDNLIRTIVWYFEEFDADQTSPILLENGKPAVEHSFKIDIGNGIFYCGHLDRGVNYAGIPYVMDQKTTKSTLSPYFFSQFDMAFQMTGYTFAGRMILNAPVKGVIIDAAQIAVNFTRFGRYITLRTEPQLDEWLEQAHWWIKQANQSNRENNYPMNQASCGNYGGCEFARVCSMAPRMREQFLKADFDQESPWNPLIER